MKSARQVALDVLLAVWEKGAYANLALDAALDRTPLEHKDRALATACVYGVLERQITLFAVIQKYSKKPLARLDPEIRAVLALGLYQLLYLDNVPDSAAVDESVRLTGYAGKGSAKGFVNALLRSFIRDGKEIPLQDNEDPVARASILYSCPTWLLNLWKEDYGWETACQLAEAALLAPPVCVRVNTLKTETEKLIGYLENRGVTATVHPDLPDCLLLKQVNDLKRLSQFKQGLFHVQDKASQLCVKALSPKPGETVLDLCSAPGSKSFTAAQYMKNEGQILSFDLYSQKCDLIREGAKRLGITLLTARVQDATVFDPTIPQADAVLCDVPCSGLGILAKKPDIRLKPADTALELPALQEQILQNAARYVKPGGRLCYSTCTLHRAENEAVVERFLAGNKSFEPLQLPREIGTIKGNGGYFTTLFPHIDGCDGFFIATMRRKETGIGTN